MYAPIISYELIINYTKINSFCKVKKLIKAVYISTIINIIILLHYLKYVSFCNFFILYFINLYKNIKIYTFIRNNIFYRILKNMLFIYTFFSFFDNYVLRHFLTLCFGIINICYFDFQGEFFYEKKTFYKI